MRASIAAFCFLFLAGTLSAHELAGTVEVLMKDNKRKSDLSDVIIYLSKEKQKTIPQERLKAKYEMSTKSKQFSPRVLAIPVGATVDFPNYDAIFHNIFSVSSPNEFDLGLYKSGTTKPKTFEHPGIVRVFCNVHPQMTATIVVSDSPYYVRALKNGNFNLGDVPDGVYRLHAFSEEGQTSIIVEMKGKALNMKLSIDASRYKKLKHKNKFGKDYPSDAGEKY